MEVPNFETPKIVDLDICGAIDEGLFVAEFSKHLPFRVKRQYLLKSASSSKNGGQHAHKELWQFFICVQGSCHILFEGKNGKFEFLLDKPTQGVVVPPGHWRDYKLAPTSVLSVLASEPYDENDYIRDYGSFRKHIERQATPANVPFVALNRENDELRSEFITVLEQQTAANDWVRGKSVCDFEARYASYCEAKHAVACGSGLDALALALRAYEIGAGDEVIVPTNSFIASALAVSHVGATPVFIDCLPCSGELDISQIELAISSKTKAIIPVHLYGIPVDMDRVMEVAGKHGLFVLEDAAQAHGALYKNNKVGSLGHAAAFSFYPTKNLGAIGDGGCVVTNDASLADRVRTISNYGSREKYKHEVLGVNSRLDSIQAGILSLKLAFLDERNKVRKQIARHYFNCMAGIKDLKLVNVSNSREPVWHIFPVFLENQTRRDALKAYLSKHSIETGIHYPIPIHVSPAYATGDILPVAEEVAKTQLSLPMSPFLTKAEINFVCNVVTDFFSRG